MYSPTGRGGRSGEDGFPSQRMGLESQIVLFDAVELGSGYGTLEAYLKRRVARRKAVFASMILGKGGYAVKRLLC